MNSNIHWLRFNKKNTEEYFKFFEYPSHINFTISLLIIIITSYSIYSYDSHPNQLSIRNDRVFLLNEKPFFPIGVCFELGEDAYIHEFKKPSGNGTYGFNFINLFIQNANLYYCFTSRNVISGDLSTGLQYNEILSKYWDPNVTGSNNFHRINNYLDNE